MKSIWVLYGALAVSILMVSSAVAIPQVEASNIMHTPKGNLFSLIREITDLEGRCLVAFILGIIGMLMTILFPPLWLAVGIGFGIPTAAVTFIAFCTNPLLAIFAAIGAFTWVLFTAPIIVYNIIVSALDCEELVIGGDPFGNSLASIS
ncbi:MAG TPA: hypothetical protein ENG74_02435 [Thermoplasmatales archaeon]|nr:hypothetical protein [Thermoplasmatales archaeon]